MCRVGRASQVRHVDRLHQRSLSPVSVQIELQYGVITVRDQSNPADSRTFSGAVDVQSLDDHAYELSHALEIVEPDTVRCVDGEYHISAVPADCEYNLQQLLEHVSPHKDWNLLNGGYYINHCFTVAKGSKENFISAT